MLSFSAPPYNLTCVSTGDRSAAFLKFSATWFKCQRVWHLNSTGHFITKNIDSCRILKNSRSLRHSEMFNVRKHPHISACLFMYLHLHCWNNIYAGKTNIHKCYVNSPQDWYGSSYCCSALRDVDNREKRKHVNLLFHADWDEKDRRGRERFWDRERQTERLISLSRSPSCTHLELCVCDELNKCSIFLDLPTCYYWAV